MDFAAGLEKSCGSKALEDALWQQEGNELGGCVGEGHCGAGMESVAAGLAEGRRKEADVYIAVLLLQRPC